MSRPVIRIIHHLGRTGGTLISRCIGCMRHVVLLSEVHPVGGRDYVPEFSPIRQAHQWFGLLNADDIASVRRNPGMDFADAIELISQRCAERNRVLVLRDWTHIDFTGVPFCAPSYRLTTAEALRDRFEVIQTTTVRHPVDQWLSFYNKAVWQKRLTLDAFLHGYRLFAEKCVEIGFMRFEDFVRAPADRMRELCARLSMDYDNLFLERWSDYKLITGATGEALHRTEITASPSKQAPPDLLDRLERNPDYRRSLELLGYSHPC